MTKPASKITRVMLVIFCLLILGLALSWCGYKKHAARENERAAERAKRVARLTIANEGSCDWVVTLWSSEEENGRQWRIPVGRTIEETLPAQVYRVEQKLVGGTGGVLTRSFNFDLAGGEKYRWRLANLLSGDEAELEVPLEGGLGR